MPATATVSATYRFSVYTFTSREIDQIIALVREWSGGRIMALDARTLSKQVRAYAQRWNLVEKRDDGKLYCGSQYLSVTHDLPLEALWRLVEPMMNGQQSIGFSIATNVTWLQLGIWPYGHRHSSEASLSEQVDVLLRLQQYGYLLVQMGGSIWNVSRWHAA